MTLANEPAGGCGLHIQPIVTTEHTVAVPIDNADGGGGGGGWGGTVGVAAGCVVATLDFERPPVPLPEPPAEPEPEPKLEPGAVVAASPRQSHQFDWTWRFDLIFSCVEARLSSSSSCSSSSLSQSCSFSESSL